MSFSKNSIFTLFTAGLALVSAYTQPTGSGPVGNAIGHPGTGEVVPAGKPYTITWDPSTKGTVTLVLVKGPSTNVIPQYAITENIPNDGKYVWTPSTDLEPSQGGEGYGIQLIDDATGQYQYSPQFGISNPSYSGSSSTSSTTTSSASSSTSTDSASTSSTSSHHGKGADKTTSTSSTTSTETITSSTGSSIATLTSTLTSAASTLVTAVGATATPSRAATTTSASGNATTSVVPQTNGAASQMAAGMGGLVFAAVAFFAL